MTRNIARLSIRNRAQHQDLVYKRALYRKLKTAEG
jgi:hypothetical protein